MTDHKKRIEAAVHKYVQKQEPQEIKQKKHYDDPEAQVVKELMRWLRANKFSVRVVESKSTYSEDASRYISQATQPGSSDIQGCNDEGLAVYIEAKAPGCATGSRLRPAQREFLTEKLNHNAFAVVTDSVDHLEYLYRHWINLRGWKIEDATKWLKDQLPKEKTKGLFD